MPAQRPPSKAELAVDQLSEKIELHAQEILKKAKRLRRLTKKHTRMALEAWELEDDPEPANGSG